MFSASQMIDDLSLPMASDQNSRNILGNVPFDILVHLLGFLCPLDILAVRQVSVHSSGA